MKYRAIMFVAVCAAAVQFAAPSNCAVADQRRPVIVELFTSEGCSDCPPADLVLTKLAKDQPIKDADIIPLEEHVSYWNNPIHWVDPFSLSQVTDRQYNYATLFNDDSPYTPEMVIDGRAHFVGSDYDDAKAAIAQAAQTVKAEVDLSIQPSGANADLVTVKVSNIPQTLASKQVVVLVAVTEDGIRSHIVGGENRGRTLFHSAVIRSLSVAGFLSADTSTDLQTTIDIPQAWRSHPLHAVAFAQSTVSKYIYGAAESSL